MKMVTLRQCSVLYGPSSALHPSNNRDWISAVSYNLLMAVRAQAFSSSAASSSTIQWNYDVFLSFRGEDTRYNFTGHLYEGLVRAGVRTFIDDEELDKGEEISRSLPKAIEESRISIIVFSRNYASSTWCLKELVKILECRREPIAQTVLPVFLDGADPSNIRKQAGSYAEAFRGHEERFEREVVDRWRAALREAGELSGWNQKDVANGHESKLIQTVVKRVLSKLNTIPLDVAKYPVGIDSHSEEMMRLLNYSSAESNHVKIVGICGMGGIGKTTIAKAIYNQIFCSFEGSSFLEDVREASKQQNGLVCLQNQLLFDILKQEIQLISNVSRGKTLIRERIRAKKVLVILDDVDENDQLQALAGGLDWFGSGSRVIVTTRDEHVLNVCEVDSIYRPKELDFHQSLQLFSNHAFGRDQPLDDYIEITKNVIRTAGGLPLALEVLGSFLFDKRRLNVWENTLEKLKKIPHKEIQEKLKISYDALDDLEKEIFLDITCFFIGTDKEYANYILEGCELYSTIGIEVLIQKSLVKIGNYNELRMHDQLRDMGREIVRKENPDEAGKRSRLWFHEEALCVLKEFTGTRNVKGLLLNFDQKEETMSEELHFNIEAFSTMNKLRLLQIDHAHLVGDFKHLPSELRWLRWRGCPLELIPTNFHPKKLAVLDLSHSKISQVWDMWHQKMPFAKLKVLNLSRCRFIIKTPHFSGFPNLEILILEWCDELVEVDESIGNLKRLLFLNLKNCRKVVELPNNICMLSSLQNLFLSHCLKLTKLPEELGSMLSLTELLVDRTAIENLPDSIGLLKNLTTLCLTESRSLAKLPDSLGRLESLANLEFSKTGIRELPNFHGSLNNLDMINIGYSQLFRIPCWIGKAINLTFLRLDGTIITELPDVVGLLVNLEELGVSECRKLVKLPDSMGKMKILRYLYMMETGIAQLRRDFGELSSLELLHMSCCQELKNFPRNFGNLVQLRTLYMDGSGIVKLPEDFGKLTSLEELSMMCCRELESLPENLGNLEQLTSLHVSNCNLSEGAIPNDIGKLNSLEYLELGGNNFHSLPAGIGYLSQLEQLHLENCTKLQALPELPSSLFKLDATNCISLQRFSDVSNMKNLRSLFLANCTKLQSFPEHVCSLAQLDATNCMSNSLSPIQILVQQGLFEHLHRLCFHGSNIPDWFVPVQFSQAQERFISEEIKVSTAEVAQPRLLNPDIEITGLIICFIFAFKEPVIELFKFPSIEVVIKKNEKTISTSGVCIEDIPIALLDHDQIYLRLFQEERERFVQTLKYGDQIQVSIYPGRQLIGKIDVKKGGIYLVCNSKEDSTTMRQSTYERLADFLTSCGDFVGDRMSGKKEMLALDAIDFSISSCSVVGDVDRLSKANEPDDDWDAFPPKPKKPKKDPQLDLNEVDLYCSP